MARMRPALRIGLIALGLPQALVGLWALFAPRHWYDGFPGLGRQWLGEFGSYDAHLASDVGSTFVAIGAMLLIAAWMLDHRVVIVSVTTYLIYAVPHALFHLTHDEVLSAGDQVFNGALLVTTVVGGLGLIWVSAKTRNSLTGRSAHTPAP